MFEYFTLKQCFTQKKHNNIAIKHQSTNFMNKSPL